LAFLSPWFGNVLSVTVFLSLSSGGVKKMYETTRLAIAMRMSRAALNLTQADYADALGITKSNVMRNEKLSVAVRGDTLIRMVHVLDKRGVSIDVFTEMDEVKIIYRGIRPDAAAMRMCRAALSLTQEEFAEAIGVTKPVVTRGERILGNMRGETLTKLIQEMHLQGIEIDLASPPEGVTVTIKRAALEHIEESEQGSELPGEPNWQYVPYTEEEREWNKTAERIERESREHMQQAWDQHVQTLERTREKK
jgi:transcriptional regulator with XRE-family HTH domain